MTYIKHSFVLLTVHSTKVGGTDDLRPKPKSADSTYIKKDSDGGGSKHTHNSTPFGTRGRGNSTDLQIRTRYAAQET